jgi:CubicO group peptidase (beta-lactamase class C family)
VVVLVAVIVWLANRDGSPPGNETATRPNPGNRSWMGRKAVGPQGKELSRKQEVAGPPLTGKPVPALAALDQLMLEYRDRIGCSAAALAVAFRGVPVFVRGYGWRDRAHQVPAEPDTLFNLGYADEPLNAAAVLQMARTNPALLQTPVFKLLRIAPQGPVIDNRVWAITVGHLLKGNAGFQDDAFFAAADAARKQSGKGQVPPEIVFGYLLTQKLKNAPGTVVDQKPNFANYELLRLVVARGTARRPAEVYRDDLFRAFGGTEPGFLAADSPAAKGNPALVWNGRAVGPVCASAPALCRFLRYYQVVGELREGRSTVGMWEWNTNDSMVEMVTREDGIDLVFLFNGCGRVRFDDIRPRVQTILVERKQDLQAEWQKSNAGQK